MTITTYFEHPYRPGTRTNRPPWAFEDPYATPEDHEDPEFDNQTDPVWSFR